jgi:hypothetical protein
MAKQAEKRIRDITNHYSWFRHKYGDVRYCIHCKKPLPKTERAPDFYVSQIGDWIEAKNNDSTGTWKCSELFKDGERANQRQFLIDNVGWLFIELSDGHGPSNTAAYLISFDDWLYDVERVLEDNDMKSIRRETTYKKDGTVNRYGADELMFGFELIWEAHNGWVIPDGHPYWYHLKYKLEEELGIVNEHLPKED